MAKKAEKKFEEDVLVVKFLEDGVELRVDLNELSQEIVLRLAKHGLSQKIGDSYAGCGEGEASGKATAVADDLKANNWSTRVAAAGPKSTQLAEALASVTGKPLEEAAALIETMEDEQKKSLRAHKGIKAELAAIKARKTAEAAKKAAEAADGAEPLNFG